MAVDVLLDSPVFFLACIILTFSFFLIQAHSNEASGYWMCKSTYNCGSIKNISYPFWGDGRPRYCGSSDQFQLTCLNNQTTFIQVGQQNFSVLSIDPTFYSMKLVQTDLSTACPWHFTNASLNPTLFRFSNYTTENLTLFDNCPPGVSSPKNVTCKTHQREEYVFYAKEDEWKQWPKLSECGVQFQVPVQRGIEETDGLNKSLSGGFVVQYIADWAHCSACKLSGGICGTRINDKSRFSCYCQNGVGDSQCPKSMHSPSFLFSLFWLHYIYISPTYASISSFHSIIIALYLSLMSIGI